MELGPGERPVAAVGALGVPRGQRDALGLGEEPLGAAADLAVEPAGGQVLEYQRVVGVVETRAADFVNAPRGSADLFRMVGGEPSTPQRH